MMTIDRTMLRKKFRGSLLGAALGDAIGATMGYNIPGHPSAIEDVFRSFFSISPLLQYTDDTHMTLGVAQSLIARGEVDGAHMADCFIRNYREEPWRGYAAGPPRVFARIQQGKPWNKAAAHVYPGGSFGNGAAMRIAPIGLFFWDNPAELIRAAYLCSRITHHHVLGTEGALLQAMAVALAVAGNARHSLDVSYFISQLSGYVTQEIYSQKLSVFEALLKHPDDRWRVVNQLGNGVEASNSVPTAIFAFLAHPQSYPAAITCSMSLGGDTDTIASMTGAISGAYLGSDAIPDEWRERLENREYLTDLADSLWKIVSAR